MVSNHFPTVYGSDLLGSTRWSFVPSAGDHQVHVQQVRHGRARELLMQSVN